ncbi:hypothetical protein CKO44_11585 [Rubrivivax gelatinosus]|uniref:DUF2868 domain-containing protein n=1 Tax=Rubrivivax gelatinosus TaxID=28068 RepID=UPI0019082974|nr:DUF2868 domain-containing protein [Rubrivivax gelatinosus]MBK1614109.1 hypothetical protein [Rubrivivax gelatinosus]
MTEEEARRVVLIQAAESAGETALWTAEDRAWATRLALQTAGPEAPLEGFALERARHALERLLPRDAAARRWLERRGGHGVGAALLLLAAFVLGAVVDHLGSFQRVDLLAPPVWAVIAWNLVVYVGLLLPRPVAGLRALLARRWLGDGAGVGALWARLALPLSVARATALLHAAAAMLALGVVAGMYLRGLVLDYRAGWQSTFLDAPFVQSLLTVLLAPASWVTGIAVPEVAPLRLQAGAAAVAPAAPWIHLYAALLALAVVLPRVVLGAVAAWRARSLARRFPLPLAEPYYERLRLQQQGSRTQAQVLPYAAGIGAQSALGLRTLLAASFGDEVRLRIGALTAFGDEDAAKALRPEAGDTLRIAVFDFGATPEAEAQGRFVDTLGRELPLLVVADEAAFRRRFGGLPERLAQRRAAWQALADARGLPLLCADLEAPDLAAAERALARALGR